MPLGAARLNTLSKVLTTVSADPRTSSSMVVDVFGDTHLDTGQVKFGNSSIQMDGTGDYMVVEDVGNNLDFGTGDFTIEWFQYLTSLDRFAIDFRNGSNGAKILLYSYPTDGAADDLYLWVNSANRISAFNCISANQWQHIALVRESGTTSLYVDGTQVGGTYSDSNNYSHDEVEIWHNSIGAENYTPPGYIDEYRITKGLARYSGASFSVPGSPFTADDTTVLLIHGDGENNSTLITDDPSAVLTGLDTDNSYYLHTSSYSNSESNTSNLTVSFWIKTDDSSTSGERYLFQFGSGNDQIFFLYNQGTGGGQVGTNGFIRVGNLDGGWKYDRLFDCGSINGDGNWHHIVYSRSGTSDQAYVDGVSKAPFTNSFNSYNNTGNHEFGSYSTAVILANSTGGGSKIVMPVCQVFIDNTYIDLSQSSNRKKFYLNGGVDMGTDGTDSSLSQPLHFFHGKTTEFNSDGGRAGQSFTQAGTGSNTNGPEFGSRNQSTWNNGGFSQTGSGVFNNALQISNGSSSGYIAFPSDFEYDDNVASTVEFRFKLSHGGTSNKTTKVFSTTSISNDNFPTSSNHLTLHTYGNGNLYFTHDGNENNLGNPGTGFHHIAMQYDGTGSFRLWLDGTHKFEATHSITTATELYFGNRRAGEGNNSGTTNTIDEIRVSSTTRYSHTSSDITVPTAAFTNDDDTVALFHCESTSQTDDNS